MNDFVQLQEETNVFQTETTIEGTLDDFDFGAGAEDERPGKSTGQEAGPAEGTGAEEGATGTKRKKTVKKDGDAKPKKKASATPRKKAVKVRFCNRIRFESRSGKIQSCQVERQLSCSGRKGRAVQFSRRTTKPMESLMFTDSPCAQDRLRYSQPLWIVQENTLGVCREQRHNVQSDMCY